VPQKYLHKKHIIKHTGARKRNNTLVTTFSKKGGEEAFKLSTGHTNNIFTKKNYKRKAENGTADFFSFYSRFIKK
jgi:hypothetical protein